MDEKIKQLRELGATEIEIRADGSIVAKFGAQPITVPQLVPYYVPYFTRPWREAPTYPGWQQPTITWGTSLSSDSITWSTRTETEQQ